MDYPARDECVPGGSSHPFGADIGKIRRVGVREVRRHEALDFTTWLEHNADVLSDALGVVIGNVDRERSAGSCNGHRFWTGLLEQARAERHPHSGVSPAAESWLQAGSGRSGVHFIYTIRRRDAAAQVVIEGPDAEVNARIFEALEADREKIEAEFGGPLQWQDRWPEVQRTMIEAMLRLDRTFRPRIQALRV